MPELGVYLQGQYDAGAGVVTLDRNARWEWQTPVFLDSPRFGDKFEVNLAGAEVALGANLPTVGNAFNVDASKTLSERVRVAIFPNTMRTSWDQATNNVNVVDGKATKQGASVRLTLKNGTLDGGGRNVGAVMANRVGTVLENLVVKGTRFALSWHDYAEPNIIRGCHFQTAGGSAQVTDAFFVYQVAKGDGVLIEALKCDGAVGAASLRECFGASLVGNITGRVRLTRCAGIVVSAVHQESGIYVSYAPNFEVINSDVLFLGGTFFPPRMAGRAIIEVLDDADGPLHSNVVLVSAGYRLPSDHATGKVGPFIDVRRRNENTRVRVVDPTFKAAVSPGVWAASEAPVMAGGFS